MAKKVFNKIKVILILIIVCMFSITGCNGLDNSMMNRGGEGGNNNGGNNNNTTTNDSEIVDNNEVKDITVETTKHNYKLMSGENNTYSFKCQDEDCNDTCSFSISHSGTDCAIVTDTTITFNEIQEDTQYSLVGTFYGNIVIDCGDDYSFELSLEGFSITSEKEVPINIISGETVLSAKKNTENYIYDIRDEVSEEDISASIYSDADLDIQGKGSLFIKSENNNGIHTKDNLGVKNLTLQIDCNDNALKGNDGVKIESGNITLISRNGDGIKTKNSHVSSKGKQKGDVKLQGGKILIYAACDGIDAAHDVNISESEGEVDLQIFTDKYSKYSEEVTASTENVIYVRFTTTSYKYSLEFSNDSEVVWQNSGTYKQVSSGMGGSQYYYSITKPAGYTKVRLFIYSSSQTQGQSTDYLGCTDYLTINNNYDTIALQSRGGSLSYGWTNYSTTSSMGPGGFGPGGMGGMNEGNSDKGDHSTKGLKASNEINVAGGEITISAYDDALHANNDEQLGEEGAYYYGTGNVTISGGNITIHSNDDGIHADNILTISNGTIKVTNSYEGLEGYSIVISGGNTSVISSDDGLNATATTGTGIDISGGSLYVYAGGDGLDANSKSSYTGFVITGGRIVVISTGNADSSLDTENGYTFTGGYVISIGNSGGMSSESKNCKNYSTYGKNLNLSLSKDKFLVVDGLASIKMPVTISALVIVLGDKNANISSASSSEYSFDNSNVYWCK